MRKEEENPDGKGKEAKPWKREDRLKMHTANCNGNNQLRNVRLTKEQDGEQNVETALAPTNLDIKWLRRKE